MSRGAAQDLSHGWRPWFSESNSMSCGAAKESFAAMRLIYSPKSNHHGLQPWKDLAPLRGSNTLMPSRGGQGLTTLCNSHDNATTNHTPIVYIQRHYGIACRV